MRLHLATIFVPFRNIVVVASWHDWRQPVRTVHLIGTLPIAFGRCYSAVVSSKLIALLKVSSAMPAVTLSKLASPKLPKPDVPRS